MRATLPEAYISQMKQLLGPESEDFLDSYDQPRTYGLRINTLKSGVWPSVQGALTDAFGLAPIPWCETGLYYDELARPGKHPYHAAGLYYIQEPSAMTAAELLDVRPGLTVLDLAAAPGGKTTQIAGKMNGKGLLIANEIHPARAKILSENVERCGIANAVVANAAPDELSKRFPAFFDRIMLDAPCSGEGMFRKDEGAVAEWSPSHVAMCAARQADILAHAAAMLKPGGRMVYSTCTFNRSENEDAMLAFCRLHPEFELVLTERVWPHSARGEGHFVAVLRRSESAEPLPAAQDRKPGRKGRQAAAGTALKSEMALFHDFVRESLPQGIELAPGEPIRFGDALYWLPHGSANGRFASADLQGLKVARPGLHLCDIRKNRAEPSHALAMALPASAAKWTQSYASDAPEIAAYLRGETLAAAEDHAGWGLIAVDGLPLGWGKASAGIVKNHLPKGLRAFK
ncbi:RsmF rRNA methyltransferase first C-terminal domain-containing protein [Paenibacillus methanolicus]|uniref:16S rRNA C967 or C1407 C5-methylase (RsmB/RsmF family) n=1 Tax=Paenibacillus methanolicus TaxID=582686 RepID=A0A5S5C5M0_9BACL|nr:RsmF rRNA methyltransferase first C-terminal domain-containing protein [Paenibacillus methanolicus]TYP73772.1 16S rRNA C967 or C1407 C5-methylase (RsmB/RsmF family) [Paenibacillus methanolicus]